MNLSQLHPTDKEVLSSIISQYRMLQLRELARTDEAQRKTELREQDRLLAYEEYAVLQDDAAGRSIQDKVLRLYAPAMRAYYATK